MARILAVDDEEQILILIRNVLKKDGHEVICHTGITGELMADLQKFDLILLDVMMPGTDGFTFCRKIRDQVDCPILFITAKTLETDVDYGFLAGADDFIKKPFSIVELRARVNAHLRRESRQKHQCIAVADIRFLLKEKEVWVHQKKLMLTKSEYEICELLIRHRMQVFSREQIYETIFGYEGESDASAITEHIKNIRKKFAEAGEEPIETVWGIGYKWN
ncbi:MAG: response regulator transcription factor [Lachnospiraceae bacterium]|nr:response regulator transcription factor [Lachnospiraceae bacterium]